MARGEKKAMGLQITLEMSALARHHVDGDEWHKSRSASREGRLGPLLLGLLLLGWQENKKRFAPWDRAGRGK